jgi:hypothetical protein
LTNPYTANSLFYADIFEGAVLIVRIVLQTLNFAIDHKPANEDKT